MCSNGAERVFRSAVIEKEKEEKQKKSLESGRRI